MAKKTEIIEGLLERQHWKEAYKLRKIIDTIVYKHVVLGLIFLRYISVCFVRLYAELVRRQTEGTYLEDREEYLVENVFYVSESSIWYFAFRNEI